MLRVSIEKVLSGIEHVHAFTRAVSAIHANSCRRRRKNRRWPKPANGSSRHQELHHLLELSVSVAETLEIDDPAKREELLQAMAHGSAAAWGI